MTTYILADNQDITRLGLQKLISALPDTQTLRARNKRELIALLQHDNKAIVVTDYTLFDFTNVDDLVVIHQRFPFSHWILFSEELSDDFVRRITVEAIQFSIVGKSAEESEIDQALRLALKGERFICRATMEQILSLPSRQRKMKVNLTPTEVEVLREIALGKTTKEIAVDRNSSFHTINTHRKNIFRKLEVNTAYEAIRYAMRAGLIDIQDYNI